MRTATAAGAVLVLALLCAAAVDAARPAKVGKKAKAECDKNEVVVDGHCMCMPGTGGATCELCRPGFYSGGGTHDDTHPACSFCGAHFTSPEGAVAADQCECEAGYGAELEYDEHTSEHYTPGGNGYSAVMTASYGAEGPSMHLTCTLCPLGTFNPGPTAVSTVSVASSYYTHHPRALPCQSCAPPHGYSKGWTTSQMGSNSADACYCRPGHGGADCHKCPSGTYSYGGKNAQCQSCPANGAGFMTVPRRGASDMAACVCLPGYGFTKEGLCELCPPGTYSRGGDKEACTPCGFGFTSPAGSSKPRECYSTNQCPTGTWVPHPKWWDGERDDDDHDRHAQNDEPKAPAAPTKPAKPAQPAPKAPAAPTKPAKPAEPAPKAPAAPTKPAKPAEPAPKAPAAPTKPAQPVIAAPTKPAAPATSAGSRLRTAGRNEEEEEHEAEEEHEEEQRTAADEHKTLRRGGDHGDWDEHMPRPDNSDHASTAAECVCKPGYGSDTGSAPCQLCPRGTYSRGTTLEKCKSCPFGETSKDGATSRHDCVPVAQACPIGQTAPYDAVSIEQCGCYPGFGGGATRNDACSMCPPGFYSEGGNTDACKPCGFGYTSPVGSTSKYDCYEVDQCPAGTEPVDEEHGPSTVRECVCKAGYGSSTGAAPCTLCPIGTFSYGGTTEACRPCRFGFTSKAGSKSHRDCKPVTQACPLGQIAPPGAVSAEQCQCLSGFGICVSCGNGATPKDACQICPVGTFSYNGRREIQSGIRSNATGNTASDDEEGEQGAPSTDARGPLTEAEASDWEHDHWHHDEDDEYWRRHRRGYLQACVPCGFGFSSKVGSNSRRDCFPVNACPAGTELPPRPDGVRPWRWPASAEDCVCKAGYGTDAGPGTPCKLCTPGTFSPGGGFEACRPCPFQQTSSEGATECVPAQQQCPVNMVARPNATSIEECECARGYGHCVDCGADVANLASCSLCPEGSWSSGGRGSCTLCPWGQTSPRGSPGPEYCTAFNECPPGTELPEEPVDSTPTTAQCVCKAGWGGVPGTNYCQWCLADYWSEGGSMDECKACADYAPSYPGNTIQCSIGGLVPNLPGFPGR